MGLTADRTARRPIARIAAACLLAAAAIPAAACGASVAAEDTTFRDTVLEHEGLIADCMEERGFDYVVGLPRSVQAEQAGLRARASGGDVEAATQRTLEKATDPNEKLLAGLSHSQQTLWGDALWGTSVQLGCYEKTYAAAWGISLGDLATKGEEFLAKVERDPAMAPALTDYTTCMAKRGHTLDNPKNVETMIGRNAAGMKDQAAEAYGSKVMADHDACVEPYNKVLAETYDRLSK